MKAPEFAQTATLALPAKRKERSLSSLVINTPKVSTQSGMTGRRSKSTARKASRGSTFTVEKPVEDQPESSGSPKSLNKFTKNMKQVCAILKLVNIFTFLIYIFDDIIVAELYFWWAI